MRITDITKTYKIALTNEEAEQLVELLQIKEVHKHKSAKILLKMVEGINICNKSL